MIGKLITMFFNFLLKIVMSIIQLICLPINALVSSVAPDFSSSLLTIDKALTAAYRDVSWAISLIPPTVRQALVFIFGIELAMLVVMRSTHLSAKAWAVLQKLKFW